MKELEKLFESNLAWAREMREEDPDFFSRLVQQQAPEYLWIGCSDSRVPSNQIVRLLPGEIFVHRNIANVVVHSDFNCLSVIEFAVDVLKVKHIIVCGHYGCAGVKAALGPEKHRLMDNWLRHIRDVARLHSEALDALEEPAKCNLLCELNVMAQVHNVCQTSPVQKAWSSGQDLHVHGWIYDIHDGLLRDLDVNTDDY